MLIFGNKIHVVVFYFVTMMVNKHFHKTFMLEN